MSDHPATIQIGMPVRNGAAFIDRALASVRRQRRTDWVLLVSDNGSTDDTPAVVARHLEDPRIRYLRQPGDLGALGNFGYLLGQATTPKFCWMAADDEWDERFLEDGCAALAAQPDRGTAFTGMVNVDAAGAEIRGYPFLPALDAPPGRGAATRCAAFLEYLGKANLIYGLHRTEACRFAWRGLERIETLRRRWQEPDGFLWGADMAFVLRLVAASGLAHSAPVRFRKRIADHRGGRLPDHLGHRSLPGGAPLGEYLFGLLLACWESTAFGDVCATLARRLAGEDPAGRLVGACPALEGADLEVRSTRHEALAPLLELAPGHWRLEWLAHLAATEAGDGAASRHHLVRVLSSSPPARLAEACQELLATAAEAVPPVAGRNHFRRTTTTPRGGAGSLP